MKQSIMHTVAGNPENQDRELILRDGPQRLVLCVADGAGGMSGGAEAASMAIRAVSAEAALLKDIEACEEFLLGLDKAIADDPIAGETTITVVVVTAAEVFGASAGDSGAWLIPATGDVVHLTRNQWQKPLIGAGAANPVSFRHPRIAGSLLLATDGLLKYTSGEKIAAVCRAHPAEIATRRLTDLVRYPSGNMPDDVTVILGEF